MFKSNKILTLSKFFSSSDNKPDSSMKNTSEVLKLKEYIAYLENNLNSMTKNASPNSLENNTISFQLGNALINSINGKVNPKNLPKQLLMIYGESLRRKYKSVSDAKDFEKLLILLSNNQELEKYLALEKTNKVIDIKATEVFDQKKELLANNSVFVSNNILNFSKVKFVESDIIHVTNNIEEIFIADILNEGKYLQIFATTVYSVYKNIKNRKAVLLLTFFDIDGNKLENIPDLQQSVVFNTYYRYLNENSDNINNPVKEVFNIQLPNNVKSIKFEISGFKLNSEDLIDIKLGVRLHCKESFNNEKNNTKIQIKSEKIAKKAIDSVPIIHNKKKRTVSSLKVATILDEFTNECLSHEFHLNKITQEEWQAQLEKDKPDFLLVESCWRGNDGNWGTLTKGSGAGKKLSNLLKYCKENSIPTVFWNKEDPPHYEKFGAVAALFDIAITTDINMVPRYKKDFGIDVYPLSFAAQPKIHNPIEVIQRLDKAVFAGSYYGDKPKRCYDFDRVLEAVNKANIDYDIYDRNYYRNIEKFTFPEKYQNNIVGNLSPDELWKVHKGYKYQINMNSVQDSSTMFARRVYESLASGTPVISNYSLGMCELFKDLVIMDSEGSNIEDRLRELEASPKKYDELARQGVRCIMREHTYGHRISEICKLIGIDVEVSNSLATLAITVKNEEEIFKAQQIFTRQSALSKHLFIEMEDFDIAHNYLNKSNDEVTYAMKFAKSFYKTKEDYYGNQIVLHTELSENLNDQTLEDFIYWGNYK